MAVPRSGRIVDESKPVSPAALIWAKLSSVFWKTMAGSQVHECGVTETELPSWNSSADTKHDSLSGISEHLKALLLSSFHCRLFPQRITIEKQCSFCSPPGPMHIWRTYERQKIQQPTQMKRRKRKTRTSELKIRLIAIFTLLKSTFHLRSSPLLTMHQINHKRIASCCTRGKKRVSKVNDGIHVERRCRQPAGISLAQCSRTVDLHLDPWGGPNSVELWWCSELASKALSPNSGLCLKSSLVSR